MESLQTEIYKQINQAEPISVFLDELTEMPENGNMLITDCVNNLAVFIKWADKQNEIFEIKLIQLPITSDKLTTIKGITNQ